jgi:hypothetical protein
MIAMKKRTILVVSVLALTFGLVPMPASATPGLGFGNYMWYDPGSIATNGTLKRYSNWSHIGGVIAGSGFGSNWNNTCLQNEGRLPNGWYSSGNDHHVDSKNGSLIDGRVWGLQDKNCPAGTPRTQLFIHTEETVANGQACTPAPDDLHCWEGTFDYESVGCVKVSHFTSVGTMNSWWHNAPVSGGHGVAYTNILWVGDSAPP